MKPDDRITVHARHFFVILYLLVPVGLSATLGTISFGGAEEHGIPRFWPAAAFQVVFPIWFGVFGAIPGIVGPMLGNGLVGASPFMYVVGNGIQSILAGWWFRRRKLDPRLRSGRDWFGLLFVGIIVANALGAFTGAVECYVRHSLANEVRESSYYRLQFSQWFAGNVIPSLILSPLLLKAGSAMFIRGPLFCQRFWGAVDRGPEEHMRLGNWDDVPIYGKLMTLVLVAGLLPLYAVGALTVAGTLIRAGNVAIWANQRVAYKNRNEIERHIDLLRGWASEYDRPDYSDEKRKEKLLQWRSRPHAFRDLEVTDAALIEPQMALDLLPRYKESGLALFVVPSRENPKRSELRGMARLANTPDQVLTGLVAWRDEQSLVGEMGALEGFLVLDDHGHALYSRGPAELTGVSIPEEGFEGAPRTLNYAGKAWYIAEARVDDPPLRIITLTSAAAGRATVLAAMPNGIAILTNLSIFVCLIAGISISRRLGGRVLELTERVRTEGGTPGELAVPVRGRDELGDLAGALNRMSRDLAVYVRELQVTTAEKERLVREMELAREVQQSVLPKRPPEVLGYELAGRCIPAFEVGGDFFDMFLTENGRLVMMIGDAVGKGLGAAMLTTETHGIVRAAALDGESPDRVLTIANHAMLSGSHSAGKFVTMFCAQLELDAHCFHYASAGHNPPVLLQAGRAVSLELGGYPLAVKDNGEFSLCRAELGLGDCVVMYTDGVTEAENPTKQMFREERLHGVVADHASASAEHLLQAILDEVRRFSEGAPPSDDLTILVLRRSPAAVDT
ncbi:MAG: SpoIIE family protein phosphatase [Phycisphaerae bacterium]|nr:SpoIIE family protein phosphatase [Phycisphaerae bacterium]